ncbi:MAG: hypothetical protein JWM95_1141 [Gemmatimonadetes bacterium]|nr:hypothetical protein [Gemmatimonadota bacterium]
MNPILDAKTGLFVALAAFAIFYVVVLVRGLRAAAQSGQQVKPTAGGTATGFVTNFFDTLGIGSYATTTAAFRHWKMVRDENIPGTLNIGHTIPTIAQAFIYTSIVPVETTTLILMILAATMGAWLGAGVVSGWSRKGVQLGMGVALLVMGALFLGKALALYPVGGNAIQLTGTHLIIGLVGNFILGALMTLGIGLYAPCLVLVALLGMNETTGFPIMMGSCAFLMPMASARFVKEKKFDAKAAVGLFVGGLPAVLIAAFIVKSLPMAQVRWLVIIVVLYTAVTMLREALRETVVAPDEKHAEGAVTL